jgi:hypothetical protein
MSSPDEPEIEEVDELDSSGVTEEYQNPPEYTAMVHRETGGSDPLVQEPKGKP